MESDKTLKTLYKEYDIPIVYIFFYQDYFTFSMYPVKVGVKVAQVGLISPLYRVFGRESVVKYALGEISGLRRGVVEKDSLKSKNFLIIS